MKPVSVNLLCNSFFDFNALLGARVVLRDVDDVWVVKGALHIRAFVLLQRIEHIWDDEG